jgi:hypothetical protein
LDNARRHSSAGANEFIDGTKFIRFPHWPYSPDLAPSDFYFFGRLKEKLKKWIARRQDELNQEVNSILRNIPEAELISIFQTWLRRLQQVIGSNGTIG